MVNDLVHKYLNHSHRQWITIGMTCLFGVLFALPAWDASVVAKSERADLESQLAEMRASVSNVNRLHLKMRDVSEQTQQEMIDGDQAAKLREDVTRIAQELDCQVRRLTLSDAVSRPWAGEQDDPFATSPVRGNGEPKNTLETRELSVSVVGDLAQLSRLTIALSRLDRFAAPTDMILQRERVNGHLRLDVTLSLFNLVENRD